MRKADNLPPYCAVVKKSRSLNFLDPSVPAWPVTGVLYLPFPLQLLLQIPSRLYVRLPASTLAYIILCTLIADLINTKKIPSL